VTGMTRARLRLALTRRSVRWTAGLLVAGAVLADLAFAMLGSVFDYPDVLRLPTEEILALYREDQAAVTLWFAVLALSAGLLAPLAVAVGRLVQHPAMRIAVPVGIAAAAVQLIGLSRWFLLVPGYAADAAAGGIRAQEALDRFRTAHRVLGVAIGETLGYLLTAGWTLGVVAALHRRLAGDWFSALGAASAAAILAGVLSPLDVPGVDAVNFAGYIGWSAWLLAFAAVLLAGARARVGVRRP
jgi:Domain of unknown function (DUF4386)